MGLMDQLPIVPSRIVQRTIRWLRNYQTPTRGQRIAGIGAMGGAFAAMLLAVVVDPVAAQWCSMPGLTWMTGQVGNIVRGVLFLCGAVAWMFCGTYTLGGRLPHAIFTFVIGLVLIALAAFAPGIAGYAMSGGGSGGSLAAMDLQCLWGTG